MTIPKEGDITQLMRREFESSESDPFKIELDEEVFPLKGRVKQFDWNAKVDIDILDLGMLGIEPEITFSAGPLEWAKILLTRHIKYGDTFETVNTFSVKRREDEEMPKTFALGATFITEGEKDYEIESYQEDMKVAFNLKVVNHLTGQTFFADNSYEEFAVMANHIIFLVEKFDEVNDQGITIATHNQLIFPNNEQTTQQIGITFDTTDSRKSPKV